MDSITTQGCIDTVSRSWRCYIFHGRKLTQHSKSWRKRLRLRHNKIFVRIYVRHTWLDNTLWHPSSWSAFYKCVRTNNDVEGWHRRLISKAGRGQLNMYLLLQLLSTEAALVGVNLTLLRESAIIRRQRGAAPKNTRRLFKAWDILIGKNKTARQTLRAVSNLLPL